MSYLKLVVVLIATQFIIANGCGDLLHAHCQLTWVFKSTSCGTLFDAIQKNIQKCCAESSILPNYTNYTLISSNKDALTLNGTITFRDGYVDGVDMKLMQTGADCTVDSCAHSHSISYFDYCANYCDGHNLVRGLGFAFTETIGDCRFVPNNSAMCPSPVLISLHTNQDPKDLYCNRQ